ncbi:MFS transporter [Sapientia aquatica]|uniref:MFS transporter n=1 Tax=Sapientia aquatica TaxID=1549640 RepID=A0A4R5VYJ8_9BURK|nr:MFS transporter [Sapientia aquatica]TDK64418.1 MFS transporter [Sapientia aquatica]
MKNSRITISVFLLYFLFAILLNSVGTVILQVIHSFNVDKTNASALEAFKDLSIAGASFMAAAFLPRFGYRKSMLMALAIMAVACIAMPFFPGFSTTKLFFMCCGISFALVKVSVYSTIGLITNDAKQHGQYMNMLEGFFMLGVLSGYWLFSQFIDSTHPESHAWLAVYSLLATACIALFLFLLGSPLDESLAHPVAGDNANDVTIHSVGFVLMLKLFAKPIVYVFLLAAFLSVLVEQGITSWLPTFNNEIMKLPLSLSVQVTSILAASTAIGRMGFGLLLKKINWYTLLAICLTCMGSLVLLTLPLTQGIDASEVTGWRNAPIAAFIFPLIGLFMAPIYPVINSLILSALPKYQHSSMTGLIVIFSALGGTTGSLITGFVFSHFSGQAAFYLTLIPLGVMLPTLWKLKHELSRC